MIQLSLVNDAEPGLVQFAPAPSSGKQPRPYQTRIIDQAVTFLKQGQSPLVEQATGTGKTFVGSSVIHSLSSWRWLWIVHRTELVHQAAKAIEERTGAAVSLELPGQFALTDRRVICASKDTIRNPKRLDRLKYLGWDPDVIVIDECHHAPAASYQSILAYWPKALRLGFTATPDRLDKKQLSCFDVQTTPYDIVKAVSESWLVPIKARRVKVKEVDLSGVSIVGGDLAVNELEAVIGAESTIHGMVHGLLKEVTNEPTIIYCPGIGSAERTCEILRRLSMLSMLVTGKSNDLDRKKVFVGFGKSYQFLVNVAVATEGNDLPSAACIALFRPTKSPALYRQMLGRGLRPLPGIDQCEDSTNSRRDWIQASAKPRCLVLDFVGVTGKHSIVTAADLWTGDVAAKVRVRQQIEAGADTIDVFEALAREQAMEDKQILFREKRKAQELLSRKDIIAKVSTEAVDCALIGMGGTLIEEALNLSSGATPGQVQEMIKLGIAVKPGMSRKDARFSILAERTRLGLATGPQLDLLRKHMPDAVTTALSKREATGLILKLKKRWTNWKVFRKGRDYDY